MPKVKTRSKQIADAPSEWHKFTHKFRRSKKGNLWRKYSSPTAELVLTVFKKPNEMYGWCIADEYENEDPNLPRFSDFDSDTEEECLECLLKEIEASC